MLLDQKRHTPNSEDVALWMANALCSLADAVIATNAQGQIIFMNGAAEDLTRVPLEQAMNMLASELVNIQESTASGLERIYPLRDAFLDEKIIRSSRLCVFQPRAGKTTLNVDFSASPLQNELGDCVGAVILLRPCPDYRSATPLMLQRSGGKAERLR